MAGCSLDITEQKLAKEALQESEARLLAIREQLPVGVSVFDFNGQPILRNLIYKARIPGAIPSRDPRGLKQWRAVDASGQPILSAQWPGARALRGETVIPGIEFTYTDDAGQVHWMLVTAVPFRDRNGEVIGGISVVNEITERKRAEEALKEAKTQAELYLDLMGHDINNINQIALGYMEMAREMITAEDPWRELLDRPVEALERSVQLIKNVRNLQRSQSRGYELNVYDLGDVIEDVASQYRAVPGRYVHISVGAVHGMRVQANELLRDVFSNLIGNAVKHSTGPAYINVRMNQENRDGQKYYRVTIDDNGPGIPDDMKGHIFNRMHMGSTKGMGLGLYLVESLVESYGGKVQVEDRVKGDHKKGARLVVMLPAIE